MGLTGICLFTVTVRYSYIKKWSVELFSENYSYSYIKNGFRIKNVMISKRMVNAVFSVGGLFRDFGWILGPLKYVGIPSAWYKTRIPRFPPKSIREGASSLLGEGRRDPKISLALEL